MRILVLNVLFILVPIESYRSSFRKYNFFYKPYHSQSTRSLVLRDTTTSNALSDFDEIKWFNSSNGDEHKEQARNVTVIEIPLFPCDDYVALPTTSGNFHFIEMNARMMMNDLYTNNGNTNSTDSSKPKLYGVVLQGNRKTSTNNNINNEKNQYFNSNINDNFDNDSSNDDDRQDTFEMAEIGTMMENTHRDLMDDGSQCCYNTCLQRFRIISIIQHHPYIIARVEYPLVDIDVEVIKSQFGNNNRIDETHKIIINNNTIHPNENHTTLSATASSAASTSPSLSISELLALELSVWHNLTDVIRLTHEYTNYQAAERGSISDVLRQLAPNRSNKSVNSTDNVMSITSANANNVTMESPDDSSLAMDDDGDDDEEYIQTRLAHMSDFSFAVADIVAVSSEDRQLLLQSNQVADRLMELCRKLNKSRMFLDSVLFEGLEAVVEVVKGEGYIISKPIKNKLQ